MSHNKTLAAQLYGEFKEFFPHNAVRYFVSYYDYYQPEAYIPQRDIYIEKDASINEEIERLRLACTSALVSRNDVIVVASVSCIYGLGSPDDYRKMMVRLKLGEIDRPRRDAPEVRRHPVRPQRRLPSSGASSASGATWSSSGRPTRRSASGSSSSATRSRPSPSIDPLTGSVIEKKQEMYIYPAKHFVLPEERIKGAVEAIQAGAGAAAQDRSRTRASCSKPSGSRRGRGTTWRCSWRSATARGSRTTAGTSPAASRARRRTPCSTSSRPTACCSSTSRTSRSRRSAACSRATSAARARSSSTASASPAPWTTARCGSTSGRRSSGRGSTSRRRPATTRSRCRAARSSSRSSARPA